jgi:hypothetical protein
MLSTQMTTRTRFLPPQKLGDLRRLSLGIGRDDFLDLPLPLRRHLAEDGDHDVDRLHVDHAPFKVVVPGLSLALQTNLAESEETRESVERSAIVLASSNKRVTA